MNLKSIENEVLQALNLQEVQGSSSASVAKRAIISTLDSLARHGYIVIGLKQSEKYSMDELPVIVIEKI